jgi:hypothetical protein
MRAYDPNDPDNTNTDPATRSDDLVQDDFAAGAAAGAPVQGWVEPAASGRSGALPQDTDYGYSPSLSAAGNMDPGDDSIADGSTDTRARVAAADTVGADITSDYEDTAAPVDVYGPATGYTADRAVVGTTARDTVSHDSGSDTGEGVTDETEAIRGEIEQTRANMSSTIDQIQEKLNPQNLVDQAKGAVREATIGRVENVVTEVRDTAREAGYGLLDTIKENPLPAALAAVGIGWLFMKSRNQTDTYRYTQRDYGRYPAYPESRGPQRYSSYDAGGNVRYGGGPGYNYGGNYGAGYGPDYDNREGVMNRAGEKVGDVADTVRDKAGDAAGTVRDTVGDVAGNVGGAVSGAVGAVGNAAGGIADKAGDAAGSIGSGVQYGATRAQNQLQRMLYENPLAVGAAAAVVGAAIGMMLPETEPEHRIMGEAKDTVLEKAQTVAQDAMQKVQRVADEVGTTVQDEAQNQGLTS